MRTASARNRAELFGRAIAVLRLSRGMSRNELARAASVGPSNLSNYERGLSQPREETLGRILEALKLPPAAIERAQEFAQYPMGRDGTLPPDVRHDPAVSRKASSSPRRSARRSPMSLSPCSIFERAPSMARPKRSVDPGLLYLG